MVVLTVVVPVPANRSDKKLALYDGQLSFAGFLLFISQCFLPGLPTSQTPISLLALRSTQLEVRGNDSDIVRFSFEMLVETLKQVVQDEE